MCAPIPSLSRKLNSFFQIPLLCSLNGADVIYIETCTLSVNFVCLSFLLFPLHVGFEVAGFLVTPVPCVSDCKIVGFFVVVVFHIKIFLTLINLNFFCFCFKRTHTPFK